MITYKTKSRRGAPASAMLALALLGFANCATAGYLERRTITGEAARQEKSTAVSVRSAKCDATVCRVEVDVRKTIVSDIEYTGHRERLTAEDGTWMKRGAFLWSDWPGEVVGRYSSAGGRLHVEKVEVAPFYNTTILFFGLPGEDPDICYEPCTRHPLKEWQQEKVADNGFWMDTLINIIPTFGVKFLFGTIPDLAALPFVTGDVAATRANQVERTVKLEPASIPNGSVSVFVGGHEFSNIGDTVLIPAAVVAQTVRGGQRTMGSIQPKGQSDASSSFEFWQNAQMDADQGRQFQQQGNNERAACEKMAYNSPPHMVPQSKPDIRRVCSQGWPSGSPDWNECVSRMARCWDILH